MDEPAINVLVYAGLLIFIAVLSFQIYSIIVFARCLRKLDPRSRFAFLNKNVDDDDDDDENEDIGAIGIDDRRDIEDITGIGRKREEKPIGESLEPKEVLISPK